LVFERDLFGHVQRKGTHGSRQSEESAGDLESGELFGEGATWLLGDITFRDRGDIPGAEGESGIVSKAKALLLGRAIATDADAIGHQAFED